MLANHTPRHLLKFEVSKLFNVFDHSILFNQESGITIITAPNGYGKTAILRLINAFFLNQWKILFNITYEKMTLYFDEDFRISVQHKKDDKKERLLFILKEKDKEQKYTIALGGIDPRQFPLHLVDQIIPNLDRIASLAWRDLTDNKRLTFAEVMEKYGHVLIKEAGRYEIHAKEFVDMQSRDEKIPDWLVSATSSINCKFIETQRLLDFTSPRIDQRHTRKAAQAISVVENQANHLKFAIQEKLAEFTNKSQELDRSFPHRVIKQASSKSILDSNLQGHIDSLEDTRSKLVSVGILDPTEGYTPISMENADQSTRSVLKVYVEDNVAKLSVFDSLYKKVSIFLEILNEKFASKRPPGAKKLIRCNKDSGLVVETDDGKVVELSELSSGEQHEIVLFYDIVFKMDQHTFLLIDEPELSLHVNWQKKFVPDLLKIISSNKMRVLLATHSPQIVHDRRDLRVSLGVHRND
ncbi:putative excinuclease ATPase subunit [Solidesulfovibrio carbinoliphilus subsp. oakridgensis]|uniref:Excinuclease ATPase subunit n=1 Tax=Solidesulfovibrio carbinoliphilus subsp. oakridgensis TaxID=694327 RepID=G7QD47_9BACT|nr:AAA family ATPase [Solidesulfovibrio carbinoliphilus]EHJ46353.1 putative excinuclease ATPase subunit [Solidesulfovibrio carbinoliphilus subsp. oakridgensis]